MKKKFIKSTIILILGGIITKLLGIIIKIYLTKILGKDILSNYMLILPTFTLLIGLSQFGMPIALSKLVAEENNNNKSLFTSSLFIMTIINIILMIIIVLFANYLSTKLLHNKDLYYGILFISLVIPFTSISSICRSYFLGKNKHTPHILSNIIEDIIRLLIIIVFFPYIKKYKIKYIISFIILSNIISELSSTIILLLFLPKNLKIKKNDLIPNKIYIKKCLSIGFYNTLNRLIGSIGYFLEPIILTNSLLKHGISKNYIFTEYGILSAYSLPILLLPSFFTTAISQAILPLITKEYINKNKINIKKIINFSIILSLLIVIPFVILFVYKPEIILKLIYNTINGNKYIKILAPIFLLEYFQPILNIILISINKSSIILKSTIISTLLRIMTLIFFSNKKYKFKGIILSIIIDIIISFLLETIYLIKQKKK